MDVDRSVGGTLIGFKVRGESSSFTMLMANCLALEEVKA